MPIWLCKQMCPSSEYSLWRSYFALKWQENSELNTEFALLREMIGSFMGQNKDVSEYMLSSRLAGPELQYKDMTEDQQKEHVRKQKENYARARGK